MATDGMLTVESLRTLVDADEIDTVVMAFTDHYGRLVGKRFDGHFFLDEGVSAGTHSCNYLLTVDMEMEPMAGFAYASWEQGYGDFHLVPDLNTLRRAAWLPGTALVLCDLVDVETHAPVSVAPRSILRRQLDRAADHGLTVMAASELEFFLYGDSYRQAHAKGYANLEHAGWYIEDYHLMQGARVESFVGAVRRNLRHSGVPVENSKGEWGRGQHEINVRYADALSMADRHVIFKQCLKETADAQSVSVTFMAKPHTEEAGSSCHIHLSLWEGESNAFAGDHELGAMQVSDRFRWFLGGWMRYLNDLMVMYAPTINSYKRYQDLSWAPTRVAWARDNRTAGFRVVGQGPSLRIECRIPGADVNPYLAYAASIAAGLAGIEQQIEPPEMFVGDVYSEADLPHVPQTLELATAELRSSPMARQALGDDVVDHYVRAAEVEIEAARRAVTDFERARYFERI
ncbi:MAG: glutamine synthetase [Acidimicrobiia bacterium]|nr:glutamine synthetase [Acidimicrobiia bacterium]